MSSEVPFKRGRPPCRSSMSPKKIRKTCKFGNHIIGVSQNVRYKDEIRIGSECDERDAKTEGGLKIGM